MVSETTGRISGLDQPLDLVQVYDHLIGSCSPDAKPYGWHDPRRECAEAKAAARAFQAIGFCQVGGSAGYYWQPINEAKGSCSASP
jgi:hypothetical protein